MASTEGAMICCIRSVASIPPDLKQTDWASEAQYGKREGRNKKSGPVAHPDANRQGPFWRDHRIVWDHEGEYSEVVARRKDFAVCRKDFPQAAARGEVAAHRKDFAPRRKDSQAVARHTDMRGFRRKR